MKITASEKFDKHNRYQLFQMILLPYPGCVHFREFVIKKYNGQLMFYDWSLPKNDAILEIPSHLSSCVYTDWSFWQLWNSVRLAMNYLQIILRQLEMDKHGILIHCQSGWHRTPLFISLLRLSLWADGYIHQSLTVEEILYLTLAYDWYLFGHNLPERLKYDEEILYFTFLILPHLVGNEFIFQPSNVTRKQSILLPTEANNHCSLEHRTCNTSSYCNIEQDLTKKTIRKDKLLALSNLFHVCYRTVIPYGSSKIDSRPQRLNIARSVKKFFFRGRPAFNSYLK